MWGGGRGVATTFVAICVVTVGTHKTSCFLLWPCHVNSISTFKTWLTDCSVIWLRVPRPDKFLLGVHLTETCGLWVERICRFTSLASDPKAESETQKERSPCSVREKRRGAMSHEDIAVQRQFCAKVITQCVKPYTKCFCRLLCEFYQRAWLVIYAGIALKLEKLGSIF